MMLLKISFRNILKNRRKSLFIILAIAFGFAAVNIFLGYTHNTYAFIRKQAIQGEGLAHLTVFKKGFLEYGKIRPKKYVFQKHEMALALDLLRKTPGVELCSPFLDVSGLISNGKVSTIFYASGKTPSDSDRIQGDLQSDYLIEGEALRDNRPNGALVSTGLAKMLGLKVGDTAVIVANTLDGMTNALDIEVDGLYDTLISATNDMSLQLPLRHAQSLYDFEGADRIVILLKNPSEVDRARSGIESALEQKGLAVEVRTWKERSLFYTQVKNTLDTIFFFIDFIVLVIVVMSIVNTMSMSVIERTREIGTMRALGLRRSKVMRLFALEGSLLGVMGSGIGLILFFGVYAFLIIMEPSYMPPSSSSPIPLVVDIVPSYLFTNGLVLTLLALVSAIMPARKASGMNVVDALGHI